MGTHNENGVKWSFVEKKLKIFDFFQIFLVFSVPKPLYLQTPCTGGSTIAMGVFFCLILISNMW